MSQLILVEEGPSAGSRHTVVAGATIGREGCEVALGDPGVSRRHARILSLGAGLAIEDLDSTNGTYLNGRRLTEVSQLGDGDAIQLGSSTLRVEAEPAGGGTPPAISGLPPAARHQPAAAPPAELYGVKFRAVRAWGLSIISLGVWTFWWLHQARERLDAELGEGRDDATLHTFCSFVPILNIFVLYWLWRDLDRVRRGVGLPGFPVGGYMVGAFFIAPVFHSLVLAKWNEYWDVRLQGYAVGAPSTPGEKAAVAIGIALFVLTVVLIAILLRSIAVLLETPTTL